MRLNVKQIKTASLAGVRSPKSKKRSAKMKSKSEIVLSPEMTNKRPILPRKSERKKEESVLGKRMKAEKSEKKKVEGNGVGEVKSSVGEKKDLEEEKVIGVEKRDTK